MKSLCITSIQHPALNDVAELLHQAGLAHPRSIDNHGGMDLHDWHRRVLSGTKTQDLGPCPSLGRLWEQLAGDLFMANLDTPLWGWTDAHSTPLLDFWHDFDPQLKFILIHIPMEQALAHAIHEHESPDLAALMAQWQITHQAMLRFHLRHPDRSILIDAEDALQHPDTLLTTLNQCWHLGLHHPEPNTLPTWQCPDLIALHLSRDLCRQYPEATELSRELCSTQECLGDPVAASEDVQAIIRAYHDLRDRSQEQTQLEQLSKEKAEVTRQRDAHQATADQLRKEKTELTQQRDAHKARVDQLTQELTTQQAVTKDAQEEAKLILLQLHQVQEELEHYFLQHQQAQQQIQDSEQALAKQHNRLKRILAHYPDHWDYEDLQITPLEAEDNASQWHFTQLTLGDRLLPELRFKLHLDDGLAGITLQRLADDNNEDPAPLLRWPSAFAQARELPCLPINGGLHQGSNAALSSLSQSDWQLLQRLTARLIEWLADTHLHLPETLDRHALHQGLQNLQATLAQWPRLPRFDQIRLIGNEQLPEYDSLEIHLDTLALGPWQWTDIRYRLASVDPDMDTFGAFPRLEFPETSRQALQQWFAETDDERGPRLELRFARPDDMDLTVWQHLSDQDQLLISTLISTLPQQLAALQHQAPPLQRAWQDWEQLSRELKRILSQATAPAPAQAEEA